MTFFQVALAIVTSVSLLMAAYFAGKRAVRETVTRWRDEHDAEHTRAERLQATLVEKDQLVETQAESITRQAARLAEKDQVISELGGFRVAEMVVQMQESSTKLFTSLTSSIEGHEARAAERHTEIVKTLKALNGTGR